MFATTGASTALLDLSPGQSSLITACHCASGVLSRLSPLGVTQGTVVTVLRNNRKHALLIEVQETTLALARSIAAQIVVEKIHSN